MAAQHLGLNLIGTSHYASEKIGMERLQQLLAVSFARDEFVFVESGDPTSII